MNDQNWIWARAIGASARGILHLAVRDEHGRLVVRCKANRRQLVVGMTAVKVLQEDVSRFRPCPHCQKRAQRIIAELDAHIETTGAF